MRLNPRAPALLLTCSILLVSLVTLAPNAAAARGRIAIFDVIDRSGAIDASLLDSLTRTLRSEARRVRYQPIDKASQDAALGRLRQAKACSDEARCAVATARDLRASAMLTVVLTRSGSDYALNAELITPRTEATLKAAHATAPATPQDGLEDRLQSAMRTLTAELFAAGESGTTSAGPARVNRSELAERRREQRQLLAQQREAARAQRDVQARRNTYWIYGLSAALTAGIAGSLGAVYLTKSIGDAEDKAAQATSPSALQTANDEAKSARTKGIVMLGIAGLAAAAATWLLLSIPSASPQVAGVQLDGLPTPAPLVGQGGGLGGLGLSWGGSF